MSGMYPRSTSEVLGLILVVVLKKVSVMAVDVMITYPLFACLQTSLFAEHVSIFY